MQMKALAVAFAAVAVAIGAGTARGDTMHPVLGAKLAGMGEHGIVNFQSMATKGRLCWTFSLSTKGVTGASIRDSAGMVVAKLGSAYSAKSCFQSGSPPSAASCHWVMSSGRWSTSNMW